MLTLGHFPGIEIGDISGQVDVLSNGDLEINYGIISEVKWLGPSCVKVKVEDETTEVMTIEKLGDFCECFDTFLEVWNAQSRAYLDLML